MNARNITDLHEEIAKKLINKLRKNPRSAWMSYKDLCRLVDNKIDPRNIAYYIGDLSVWCHEIKAPMISALIYNQETNIPGKGFIKLYSSLYDCEVKKGDEEIVLANELRKVLNYKKWNKLEAYLGI